MLTLETAKQILGGWANQMYARFGYPVYLVGSILTSDNPRDLDIRIVLPDPYFEARYGDVDEWYNDMWQMEWRKTRQKWARDMAKISLDVSIKIKKNIDFQVEPEKYANIIHQDKPKVRIDTIKEEEAIEKASD